MLLSEEELTDVLEELIASPIAPGGWARIRDCIRKPLDFFITLYYVHLIPGPDSSRSPPVSHLLPACTDANQTIGLDLIVADIQYSETISPNSGMRP